jgi:hypothetical protein
MIAAMRNLAGDLVAVHRTLSADAPTKLVPPGDRSHNTGKKVLGRARGSVIWLGKPCPITATGEGIETALAWYSLGIGPDEVTVCAAYSLGNMSGSALGTTRHPTIKGRTIYNGEPDPERPGVIMPAWVRETILLGDGDPPTTMAHLVTAGRRFKTAGLTVSVSMAPAVSDWNDVLLARGEGTAWASCRQSNPSQNSRRSRSISAGRNSRAGSGCWLGRIWMPQAPSTSI